MLEIRPGCEHCDKDLPNDSSEAMICTFECTFCSDCSANVFNNVCPNCGGNFQLRPTRPKNLLEDYPLSTIRVFKPKDV